MVEKPESLNPTVAVISVEVSSATCDVVKGTYTGSRLLGAAQEYAATEVRMQKEKKRNQTNPTGHLDTLQRTLRRILLRQPGGAE